MCIEVKHGHEEGFKFNSCNLEVHRKNEVLCFQKTYSNPKWGKCKDHAVMQYNVLGQVYAISKWFPNCNPDYLQWNYRKEKLKEEIAYLNADILCLQELDHYSDFFQPQLASLGYSSVYLQRPEKEDGCGIFYKRSKFTLLASHGIHYRDAHKRIGLIAAFQTACKEDVFSVSTTHLHWDQSAEQVQLAEIKELIGTLRNPSGLPAGVEWGTIPSIVCGDFNSEKSSAVYQYMSECKYRSSYHGYRGDDEEAEFTHYLEKSIDYIWYKNGKNRLVPTHVLEIPSKRWIEGGLPSSYCASDHISLMTVFAYQ